MNDLPDSKTPERVLVVDDDSAARLLMRQSMEGVGFEVEEAGNGREAIEQFIEHRPGIVLMDVDMPVMDGFSACKQIRHLPGGATLPIVMVTGLDDFESIHRAYDIGATDFVTKPINWLILSYRVRYLLRANRALDDLSMAEQRLARAQEIAHIGSWEWQLDSDRLLLSDEARRILGLDQEAIGQGDLLGQIDADDRPRVEDALNLARQGKDRFDVETRLLGRDGIERIVRYEGSVIQQVGAPSRAAGTLQDLTEKRKTEQEIRFLAYYDRLTQLPNRFLFRDRLEKSILHAQRQQHNLAVLFLNLDNFKSINDAFGHQTGDQLLQLVAKRILECLRQTDTAGRSIDISSRFGADEFGIIVDELHDLPAAAIVARRVLDAVANEIQLNGQSFYLSSRIGISVFPQDGDEPELLIRNAAAALSRARELGKNSYQFYTTDLNARAYARYLLEGSLRRAMEEEQFQLYYQPKVDLESGRTIGVEALIRWLHPERGLVAPDEFIPMAEETGLIIPMGEWIMRAACKQVGKWQQNGFEDIQVAINLSAMQFRDQGLLQMLQGVTKPATLKRGLLELEITESMLMDRVESGIATLEKLRDLGALIAIDDFGTGYSSLSYLKRFPLHTLKIDRSFISDLGGANDDSAIVEAVISMARSLNITVVAEGVETLEQLQFLEERGCDLIQGYLVSKPLPGDEVEQFFGGWNLYKDVTGAAPSSV